MTNISCTSTLSPSSSTILVLESDATFSKDVALEIWAQLGMKSLEVARGAEALDVFEKTPSNVFAAAVYFNSPDANALLERLTQEGVPVVAYGDNFTHSDRKQLATWGIADLVVGDSVSLPKDIAASLARLAANKDVAILVVDDSRSMRAALARFLSTRCYRVMEASDGVEALEILGEHPEIQLVITDNEMPNMDGFSLVREIRKTHSKDDLAVIGISAKSNSALSVQFITNGANDFLQKPFVKEELYCRVDHNVEMLNRIRLIRELSYKDPLTKLFNRRYFFENCDAFIADARERGVTVSVGMADIDHFKSVNDTYGHDGGDTVLKVVAASMADSFGSDGLVSRFGGEEFCFLVAHGRDDDLFARYDSMRRLIERTVISMGEEEISVTISVGVSTEDVPVDEMISIADGRLYVAKESGRNRVVTS